MVSTTIRFFFAKNKILDNWYKSSQNHSQLVRIKTAHQRNPSLKSGVFAFQRMKLQSLKPRIQPIKTTRLNGAMPVDTQCGTSWRFGKSSAERGYGRKWREAREGWLRKHPLCVFCQRKGQITMASVVDHIEPHRGDMVLFWKSENWQSLCKSCHDGEKARIERGGRGKSSQL